MADLLAVEQNSGPRACHLVGRNAKSLCMMVRGVLQLRLLIDS